ncbi:hypothetical protein [Streptomyces albicerus]|uniref:hypothetical protein n=1 Tax=Streptomyces albicerus TaxID=2569859 RepID=UPI00124B2073|nr:hypothetical protein [Streptomyces albicerus]
MGDNMPEDDRRNALLVRDAMERTVAELPPAHDLVPPAVTQGRRRRARARLTIAAGAACVAGAVVFGAVTLPAEGDGGRTVRPAASSTPKPSESLDQVEEPEPYRTPVHVEPTNEEEQTMADLSPAERERQQKFQQQAAVLLDDLLPDKVGLIRPVDLEVRRYQGENADGKVFPVIFSVRPSGSDSGPKSCPSEPGALKGGSCEEATLPGGIKATSYRLFVDSAETTGTLVSFSYGNSEVSLTVSPDEAVTVSAPVTSKEMLAAVGDTRFLDLVRYADENPMQERQTSIVGG